MHQCNLLIIKIIAYSNGEAFLTDGTLKEFFYSMCFIESLNMKALSQILHLKARRSVVVFCNRTQWKKYCIRKTFSRHERIAVKLL